MIRREESENRPDENATVLGAKKNLFRQNLRKVKKNRFEKRDKTLIKAFEDNVQTYRKTSRKSSVNETKWTDVHS